MRPLTATVAAYTVAAWALLCVTAGAEVIDRSAGGFTVKTSVQVAAPPGRVYAALLQVGSWWDKDHTYSGDAKNLTISAQAGGCFCEKLPGGGAVEHGRVVNVAPGQLLRLSAALGPLQELGVSGALTWQIEAAEGKQSRLTMTYAVGGYAAGGLDKLAAIVDTVLSGQVKLLKAYTEK